MGNLLPVLCVVLVLTAPISIAVSQMALGLATLLALIRIFRSGGHRALGLEIPFLLLLGWALLTIPFSADPVECIRNAKRFLLLPAIWIMASVADTEHRRRQFLITLLLSAAGVAIYGIIDYLRGPGGLAGRAELTQGYMTSASIMMFCGLVLLTTLLHAPGKRLRIGAAAALPLVIMALLITYTRSAILGFTVGSALILTISRPRLLILLPPLVLLLLLLAPDSLRDRLRSSFDPAHPKNVQRVMMWRAGWHFTQSNPIMGLGDRGMGPDLREYYREYHPDKEGEIKGHLHSNYVMFGAIWGFPGLALTLLALGAVALNLARRLRSWRRQGERAPPLAFIWTLAALGCWAAFMTGGLFEWSFGDAEVILMFWLLIGLGLSGHPTEGGEHETA